MTPNKQSQPAVPGVPAAARFTPARSKPVMIPEPDHNFWDRSMRRRLPVKIRLLDGNTTVEGVVLQFGKFNVLLDTAAGPLLIFKHAMASASELKP